MKGKVAGKATEGTSGYLIQRANLGNVASQQKFKPSEKQFIVPGNLWNCIQTQQRKRLAALIQSASNTFPKPQSSDACG